MKKLSILLSALFIALSSVFAVDVAKIGETNYETLQAAVDDVQADETIVLLDNLDLTATVNLNVDKKYTIDLDAKTITSTVAANKASFSVNAGDVTITNGTITSNERGIVANTGKLTLTNLTVNAKRCLCAYDNSYTIVGNGAKLHAANGDNSEACIVIWGDETKNPKLDIYGEVTSPAYHAISGNGTDKSQPVINIYDGAVITSESVAIYQPSNTTLTISGGTITGSTAVYVKCGSVSVTGGKLVGNGAAADYSYNGNGCNPTGDALVIDNCNYPQGVPSVSITDGEFESENASAVSSYVGNNVDESEKVVDFIEGGTFVSAENHEVANALLAEGVEMKEDPQNPGSYIVEEIVPVITVEADKLEFGEIEYAEAPNGKELSLTVSVTENAQLNVAVSGEQKDNFAAEIKDGKLIVTFTADAAGTYAATVTLSAEKAESKTVALSATVKAEQVPVQNQSDVINYEATGLGTTGQNSYFDWTITNTVSGAEYAGNSCKNSNDYLQLRSKNSNSGIITTKSGGIVKSVSVKFNSECGTNSNAKNLLQVYASNTAYETIGDIYGTAKAIDTIKYSDGADQTYTFKEEFKYVAFRSADGAMYVDEIKIEWGAEEPPTPTTQLSVSPETAEIEVGGTVELSVKRDGTDKLTWGSKDEAIATVDAKGVVTGVAEGEVKIFAVANEKSDTCVVTVKKATVKPVITVDPTSLAWGTLTIEKATEGVKKEAAVSVTENATLSVEVTGDDKAAFTATINGDKLEVTFKATEARAYAAKAVVKATDGAKDVEVALTATVKAAPVEIPSNFVKVTNEPKDWSGMYFIVYENEDKGLIFNGKDEVNGYVEGTIENNTIDASKIENYADYVVTIAPMTNGYSLKIGEQYLAGKSGSNTIVFGAEPALATISIDEDGNVAVVSNTTQFAFNSASNQMRFRFFKSDNQQAVTLYKAEAPKATTTLSVQETAEVAVGKTVTLNVNRDGNDKLTWKSMDETVATVANGVVTGVKEGEVKIAVSVGNLSDTCTVAVVAGETPIEPGELEEKTIAEFIEAKGMECLLTGVVSNIKTDKDGSYNVYGNFDLTDESGTIYVYGLLTAEGEAKQFQSLGVDEGDTLTVIAKEYLLYTNKSDGSTKDEVVDAIFVSVKKAQGGTTPVEPGEELDVDFGQALYWEDEQGAAWQIMAYDYENEYPMIYFIIDANDKTHLNGTYDIYEGGLWTTANDSVVFGGGTATITCVAGETEEAYAIYQVDVTMVDEDGKEYSYSFQVEVVAIDYDNSTENNPVYITLEDIPSDEPGDQAIDNTVVIDANAPVYNIQGMQVNRNTRGILIQNGQKFILLQ